MYEPYLEHYGTEGMHWGERRYQNPDGSLTPAGRKRYGVGPARDRVSNAVSKLKSVPSRAVKTIQKLSKKAKNRAKNNRVNKALEAVSKGDTKEIVKYASVLSNKELNDALNRAQTINNIKRVEPSKTDKVARALDTVNKGVDIVSKVNSIRATNKDLKRKDFELRRDREKSAYEMSRSKRKDSQDAESHMMDMLVKQVQMDKTRQEIQNLKSKDSSASKKKKAK